MIARFMGPTWGPSGAEWTQLGPMLAPMNFAFWSGPRGDKSKDYGYISQKRTLEFIPVI